ncbi:hypothetical protein C6497_16710 [Candidatus Poribacteria bacterium]|nr:MAG: hypothetical protein C6497_16710 [Candidatus Poribacteria bacterium]
MKHKTQLANIHRFLVQILIIFLSVVFLLNGCTALQEAQKRKEKRLLEKRNVNNLMLSPSDATIDVDPNPSKGNPHGISDHYTLTFMEDLLATDAFDEIPERETFALSALGYMESLYDALYDIFGFKPEHKIHVKLHDIYQGTRLAATTTTITGRRFYRGGYIKTIRGIEMDFPKAMYDSPGTRVHELTHAFTNIYYLPTWFSEGIAVLMQSEYARGGAHPKFDNLERNLRLDLDGINLLESWGGHTDLQATPLSTWRYSYAYTVVSELRKRFGNDYYIKVFELMEEDQLHIKLEGDMPTSMVVYYLSKAAGEDLVPFFRNLQFRVSKLDKTDILNFIEQSKPAPQRRN